MATKQRKTFVNVPGRNEWDQSLYDQQLQLKLEFWKKAAEAQFNKLETLMASIKTGDVVVLTVGKDAVKLVAHDEPQTLQD